jgi:hypothetical protein
VLYVLKPSVQEKPRWDIEETVKEVVEKKFAGEAEKALAEAMKSAQ